MNDRLVGSPQREPRSGRTCGRYRHGTLFPLSTRGTLTLSASVILSALKEQSIKQGASKMADALARSDGATVMADALERLA